MSLVTIEGTYEDGRVALAEVPSGIQRSRVIVTFLPGREDDGAVRTTEALDERRETACRFFGRMERGIDFGGAPYLTREELHDRHASDERIR